MKVGPLQNSPQGSLWKSPFHYSSLDLDGNLVITVFGVKMRRGMITIEHADHNSKKTTDLMHSSLSAEQITASRYLVEHPFAIGAYWRVLEPSNCLKFNGYDGLQHIMSEPAGLARAPQGVFALLMIKVAPSAARLR